jgi:tetratricopeptide (TPR) repeat protein
MLPEIKHWKLLFLVLPLCLLSACATNRKAGSGPAPGQEVVNPPFPRENGIGTTNLSPAMEDRAEAYARFAAGLSAELREENQEALTNYLASARKDPANEPLVLELTRSLAQQKDYARALELLQHAASVPNASGWVYARQGWTLLQVGRTNEAVAAFQTMVTRLPEVIPGYQSLFAIHLQTGRPKEALKILDRAAQVPGTEAPFKADLAELYARYLRQFPADIPQTKARFRTLLEQLQTLKPANPVHKMKMADAWVVLGELPRAVEVYTDLVSAAADNPPLRASLREKLAGLYLQDKDPGKAAQQWEAIVRDHPTNPLPYYYLGSLAFDQKDYVKAAEYLSKTVLLNPDFEQGYYDTAGAHLNANHPEAALEILDRARQRFSHRKFAMEYYCALAHTRRKDYPQALKYFTAAEVIARATETNRWDAPFLFQLGACQERLKHFAEAEKYFEQALEIDPDYSEAMNYLGYMWAEQGRNLERARQLLARAIELEPKNGAYWDSLAWVYHQLKKDRQALEHQQRALKFTTDPDSTLYDHLGDIHAALHEWDKAVEAWRKALELEPGDAVKQKLERVPGKP